MFAWGGLSESGCVYKICMIFANMLRDCRSLDLDLPDVQLCRKSDLAGEDFVWVPSSLPDFMLVTLMLGDGLNS